MIKVRIREMAEKQGITTAYQLQKAANVSPASAAKWFKNDVKALTTETLNLLCNVLKCTPNDLIDFEPDVKKR